MGNLKMYSLSHFVLLLSSIFYFFMYDRKWREGGGGQYVILYGKYFISFGKLHKICRKENSRYSFYKIGNFTKRKLGWVTGSIDCKNSIP